ncbi:MAG: nucleotidyl transferase AbiEii/AbiGii toxin family protein [Hyphomonadaceae bacterium]|nr:nucleotidyl transferase AbiEii/AbiGii toxin family protein [Hyphomonadaceae bacterium]
MTDQPRKDLAASVRDRLRNHARTTGQDFQRVLVRYGIERLLYRLAQSGIRDRFVLKGAMLFVAWADAPFRATGDIDLLAFGDPAVDTAKSAFASLCDFKPNIDDGLIFQTETIVVERTREGEDYQGLHIRFDARLKNIRIPILIDVGFGDVIHPAALDIDYPCLLADFPSPHIRAYPPATVVAEKFDAMVRFGDQATRLKDHYDVWAISKTFEFDVQTLTEAVRQTLANRDRATPTDWPASLTAAFGADEANIKQWNAFIRRTAPTLTPPPFAELLAALRTFLGPVLRGLQTSAPALSGKWRDGRWTE